LVSNFFVAAEIRGRRAFVFDYIPVIWRRWKAEIAVVVWPGI